MKNIFLLTATLTAFCCQGQDQKLMNSSDASNGIKVYADKKIHPIQPYFWGTNFLFWIEDDAALAQQAVEKNLKEINIKLLRYPGGTVADNFHWKTNKLENVHMFPFQEGETESDFDEFMQVCQRIGAEPSVVINTESWAVKKDLSAGAHEAANWLRYCKKKGYQVKFWEIGNETYWHPVMSASEYADLVNIYADSLKKVDPEILIGVNGHWDIHMVGTKERFKTEAYDEMMALRTGIGSRQEFEAYKSFIDANKILPITKGDTKWWETVIKGCGHHIDMLVVHWYFSGPQLAIMADKLKEVRALFHSIYPQKPLMLNISEYNTTKSAGFKNDEHLYLAEAIGAMLQAGADMASFWPMRMKGIGKSTLLHHETDKPSVIAKIHQQLAQRFKGSLVDVVTPEVVPAFASCSDSAAAIVLSGRLVDKPVTVAVNIINHQQKFNSCHIWRISGKDFDYRIREENLPVWGGSEVSEITIDPLELVVVDFRK